MTNWTPAEDDRLRRIALDGLSFEDAAQYLGRTRNMVAGRAKRLGVKFNGPRDRYIKWPAHIVREARALARTLSYAEVSRRLSVAAQTVVGWNDGSVRRADAL